MGSIGVWSVIYLKILNRHITLSPNADDFGRSTDMPHHQRSSYFSSSECSTLCRRGLQPHNVYPFLKDIEVKNSTRH
jgi:hypothetical protein